MFEVRPRRGESRHLPPFRGRVTDTPVHGWTTSGPLSGGWTLGCSDLLALLSDAAVSRARVQGGAGSRSPGGGVDTWGGTARSDETLGRTLEPPGRVHCGRPPTLPPARQRVPAPPRGRQHLSLPAALPVAVVRTFLASGLFLGAGMPSAAQQIGRWAQQRNRPHLTNVAHLNPGRHTAKGKEPWMGPSSGPWSPRPQPTPPPPPTERLTPWWLHLDLFICVF